MGGARFKREFIFVDEHGDPGPPGQGTKYFASIALRVTDEALPQVVQCFAGMRHWHQISTELKAIDKNPTLRPLLAANLKQLSDDGHVRFSVTFLDKGAYTGPYLEPGQGNRFRNFQLRRLLEWHFAGGEPLANETELVIDRHGQADWQVAHTRDYLARVGYQADPPNRNLPRLHAVTAVDSRYVEMIEVADLALRMFRRASLELVERYVNLDLSFIRACNVTNMQAGWSASTAPEAAHDAALESIDTTLGDEEW